jgi:anaerobic magnesium-protoporphyrin IX monomethyl ester cyclase
LPGTPFYERVRESMAGALHWIDSSDMAMLFRGPYPTSFYRQLHTTLHTEFRLRRASRHRAWPLAAMQHLRSGRARRGLGLLRDAAMLPVQRTRLELARRRTSRDETVLPVKLSRAEAAAPSEQEQA